MKTKTLWDDEYTTITQTQVQTKVVRHYDDTDDYVTYLDNDIGNKLVADMHALDDDSNLSSLHYLIWSVREIYKTRG